MTRIRFRDFDCTVQKRHYGNGRVALSLVDPYLGVEVKENDTSHLRRLVERYLDRKAGAA